MKHPHHLLFPFVLIVGLLMAPWTPANSAADTNEQEYLDPERAFVLSLEVKDPRTLVARWDIAEGYHLYRDKFAFNLSHPDVALGRVEVPAGEVKEDPSFGRVEILTGALEVMLPLERGTAEAVSTELSLRYQGCAKAGLCYPPIKKKLPVHLLAVSEDQITSLKAAADAELSETDQLARRMARDSLWMTLASFLGFGLLLSFTPCVLPMVPILSGIIAGRAEGLTTRRAFTLSLVFVLSAAVTYAVFGVFAALAGQNIQVMFQNHWVLGSFAGLFVLLALSMFGVFKLQLPSGWLTRVSAASDRQRGGTLGGVAGMGALSALIVGPCVAPPLAGALLYIGQSGDVWLGGLALFALGVGMGLPLLVVGASAGSLLPKAGVWMQSVQNVFGVLLLGVAIWLLDRVLPAPVIVLLWGLLLIVSAIYLGAVDALETAASSGRRLAKGLGIAMLIYGGALTVGAAGGATSALQPLAQLSAAGRMPRADLQFTEVKGSDGLEAAVRQAQAAGKLAVVDVYADWCVECKELEHNTFTDRSVQQSLADLALFKVDVTANDERDRELLKALELYGPPAILFYRASEREERAHRVVGYLEPDAFRRHVEKVKSL
jgi:thiol:disulfide interchange protein DsbD